MSDIDLYSANPSQLKERMRYDFNFFAMICVPEEFTFAFPLFYLSLFSILTAFKARIERYAIGLPRGFAKTTYMKLIIVWIIFFTNKQFILIVGASEPLAENILADVADILDSHNIRKLFGNWRAGEKMIDQARTKVFHFLGRNIILRAVGAGTSVRGINRKHRRPDFILMDDIQSAEDAPNAILADQLYKWMLGTLMKARSPKGCTYVYVGNMYPQNCILAKLMDNSRWTSLVVGGILADGTSLWPELKPIAELIDEYQADLESGHPEIFMSEVMNCRDFAPLSGIDVGKLPRCPQWMEETPPDGGFILIDPSSGKKKGDDCGIMHISMLDGKFIVDDYEGETLSPIETIRSALKMAVQHQDYLICVEDVAYQSTLLFWFNYVCEQEGIEGFEFEPVSPRNQAKNNRIKKGLTKWQNGEIYVVARLLSQAFAQILSWDPRKIENVDEFIDLIGYIDEVQIKYAASLLKRTFDMDTNEIKGADNSTLELCF